MLKVVKVNYNTVVVNKDDPRTIRASIRRRVSSLMEDGECDFTKVKELKAYMDGYKHLDSDEIVNKAMYDYDINFIIIKNTKHFSRLDINKIDIEVDTEVTL